jgi:ATP phosphoribosyltransferase regulatory subunit
MADATRRFGGLRAEEATKAVEAELNAMGAEPVARTAADIALRLREKATDPAPEVGVSMVLAGYLDISMPASDSVAALEDFARETGVELGAALVGFRDRMALIAKLRPPFWSDAVFSAEAGRRFEYYDGFVFELANANEADRPIVSGGRYDGLITRLSEGEVIASGIGAAIRADRLGRKGVR